MSKSYKVAIVGATGAVGREMLSILDRRNFPVSNLLPLASSRSAGTMVPFRGQPIEVAELTADSFDGIDLALFSAGGSISLKFSPIAGAAGAVVVDNSSAFRMHDDVPLVVPEINATAATAGLKKNGGRNLIANPNCSTIQMVVALAPLHREATLTRVIVSTYQSVSGAGMTGVRELLSGTRGILNEDEPPCSTFPHRIAFNAIPHIDVFGDNGYTREERKMVLETRKIMDLPDLALSATCVRIAVLRGHSEAVTAEFETELSADRAREVLTAADGIIVVDDPANACYPLPRDASGKDDTFVGRIRNDLDVPKTLHFWVVSDNLLKGAALNAVQIAEFLASQGSLGSKD